MVSDAADGVKISGQNMRTSTQGVCTNNVNITTDCDSRRLNDTAAAVAQPTIVRFGRLRLMSAHGSERLNLPIPMTAQYWNGTMFVTNTLDNCTQIINSNTLLLNYQDGATATNIPQTKLVAGAAGTSTFVSGVGKLTLQKPTSAFTSKGSVDVCVDLGPDTPAAPLPTRCVATSAAMPWLQGRWSNATYIDDPKVRATFGAYKSEFIYLREIH
jgi:MSHA biogenesis protein MshQ